jgi:hypothetical protein
VFAKASERCTLSTNGVVCHLAGALLHLEAPLHGVSFPARLNLSLPCTSSWGGGQLAHQGLGEALRSSDVGQLVSCPGEAPAGPNCTGMGTGWLHLFSLSLEQITQRSLAVLFIYVHSSSTKFTPF